MGGTKGCETARWSQSQKAALSSDCTLQLECMKVESLVIVYQNDTVNTFPGLVHTAREQVGLELRSLMTREQPTGEPSVG